MQLLIFIILGVVFFYEDGIIVIIMYILACFLMSKLLSLSLDYLTKKSKGDQR